MTENAQSVAEPVHVAAPAGAALEDVLSRRVVSEVLSEERQAVLDRLSRCLLADPFLRKDAATVALAFWLRRANMARLRESFLARLAMVPGAVAVPCGRVFHIAPANVDTLFVYSWALSFLCGNMNVVRLSTRTGPVVQALISCLNAAMTNEPQLRDANAFVQYERSDAVNAQLSAWCTHRIVWGGNETVNALRRVPLNPHASERSFASKYSWSAFRAAAWLSADHDLQRRTAEQFYNDVFWFDQMACSSPQVVFWIGGEVEAQESARHFDAVLGEIVAQKSSGGEDVSTAVRRRNHAFSQAVQPGVLFDPAQRGFTTVQVSDWRTIDRGTCGGGYLTHARAGSLQETAAFVTEEDQTVTHFGFAADELQSFALLAGARGLDRVVPVGQALSFSPDWDGYSLFQDFVRLVTVTPV